MRNPRRPLATLKNRRQFLQVKNSSLQFVTKGFILQVKQAAGEPVPSVGFIVTRKLGGAVERNRIKRRLRAVAQDVIAYHGKPNYWYVFIGRSATYKLDYDVLLRDLQWAMKKLEVWEPSTYAKASVDKEVRETE